MATPTSGSECVATDQDHPYVAVRQPERIGREHIAAGTPVQIPADEWRRSGASGFLDLEDAGRRRRCGGGFPGSVPPDWVCLRRGFGLAGDPFRHPHRAGRVQSAATAEPATADLRKRRLITLCPRCSVCRPQGNCAELRRGWARTPRAQGWVLKPSISSSFVRFAGEL